MSKGCASSCSSDVITMYEADGARVAEMEEKRRRTDWRRCRPRQTATTGKGGSDGGNKAEGEPEARQQRRRRRRRCAAATEAMEAMTASRPVDGTAARASLGHTEPRISVAAA